MNVVKAGLSSPITTWTGVAAAAVGIILGVLTLFDSDPKTNPDAEQIGLALLGIIVFLQGLFSRQANVSSRSMHLPLLFFTLILFGAGNAMAQIQYETSYKPYEPIILNCDCSAQDDTESVVYLWMIPDPAQSVIIDNGKAAHVWAPPGRYKTTVFAVITNWKDRTQRQSQYDATFTVTGDTPIPPGPGPGPDPNPNPVPPDRFNNIGQRINELANRIGLDHRAEMATVYTNASKHLTGELTPLLPTIPSAYEFVRSEGAKYARDESKWQQFGLLVDDEWQAARAKSKTEVADLFVAFAAGLNP